MPRRQKKITHKFVSVCAHRILTSPVAVIPAMEAALNDYVKSGQWDNQGYNDGLGKKESKQLVRFQQPVYFFKSIQSS